MTIVQSLQTAAWGALRPLVAATIVLGLSTAPRRAEAQTTDQLNKQLEGVGVTERLGAAVPRDLVFTDDAGQPSTLADRAGKPFLLSLNYVHCKMLCSLQLGGVANALKNIKWKAGEQFDLVTVSIDPRDSIAQVLHYKQRYVGQAGGGPALERGWHFLVGSPTAVKTLADTVGFSFTWDAESGDYRHQPTLIVVGRDGRVSSYLHGIEYPADVLQAALERAARAEVITAKEQSGLVGVLMNCFRYDPKSRAPLGLFVMRAGGVVVILFLAGFLGIQAVRRPRPDRT